MLFEKVSYRAFRNRLEAARNAISVSKNKKLKNLNVGTSVFIFGRFCQKDANCQRFKRKPVIVKGRTLFGRFLLTLCFKTKIIIVFIPSFLAV